MALQTFNLLTEVGDLLLQETGDGILLEGAYQGAEVLDFWPNWEAPPIEGYARSSTVLDNTTGLAVVKSRADQGRTFLNLTYRIIGRDEIARFRRFIKRVRGRQLSFWVPTWEADLVPTANVSTTSLVVESVGYTGRFFPVTARKHLALVHNDRTIYPRGVTAAADNGTTETLTLDSAPGQTILAASCLICFLLRVRLDQDDVQYTYLTPTIMDCTLQVAEVPKEAPAP